MSSSGIQRGRCEIVWVPFLQVQDGSAALKTQFLVCIPGLELVATSLTRLLCLVAGIWQQEDEWFGDGLGDGLVWSTGVL